MNELQLIKQANFGEIQADFYSNDKEVFMTINQLAQCLGYSSKSGVENMLSRNEYLKSKEFSNTHKLWVDNKLRDTRVFTEDGIYEVTMLSKTEKAREFRAWVRKILKSLRKGESKLVSMTEYQKLMAQTRIENARIRKAQILTKLADQYDGTYKQVLQSYATKELTGEALIPLPRLEERLYTATEIGDILGISANKVGKLTNTHNLKTDEYGKWFHDKSRHSNKEVESFKYNERIIPVLKGLIEQSA